LVKLLNRIAVPITTIKPNKQLTAVMMIALLLIEVLLYLFGCTGNGGSIGCDTELTVGKGNGVDGKALPGIESGVCEAVRLGILIKRRQLGQRIALRDEVGTRLRVPQIQSTNIAGVLQTDRIGLLTSFGILTHRLAAGLADGTSTGVLHSPHRIFVPRS
jgi:hypothetical protein